VKRASRASAIGRARWTAELTARAPLEARFPFRPAAAIERAQRRRLRATVDHAHEHVPYYRETMRRLGLGPGDIATPADLAKLPLIEREQLQRDPEFFVSRAEPLESYVDLRTAGSTGEPILYFRDAASLFQRFVGFQRQEPTLARLTGRRLRRRVFLLVPPSSSTTSVNRATRERLLRPGVRSVHRVASVFDPLDEVARGIDEFRPHVITGYGSSIEALYSKLGDGDAPVHRPKVVVYAADPVSDPMRRMLTDELGIETLSVYQAVESPTIGWECERHRGHHLNLDLCPIRILDPERRELPVGESGQIAISNLVNRGTVLLNYLLGDLVTRLPEPCECGRTLPLLSYVEGRTTDWLQSLSGRPVHPQALRGFLRFVPGIRRYQLVQEQPGQVRIVIVAAPDADREAIRSRVVGEAAALDEPLEAEVEFSDDLPRTEGGKVRILIQEAGSAA
jgi:phenylacetate-CoA ligase